MNKLINLLTIFVCVSTISSAQTKQHTITGRVVDNNGSPVEYASAYMVRVGDSQTAFRAGADSDSTGSFHFEAPKGDYMFEVYFLGYEKYLVPIMVDSDINLGYITIKPVTQSIKGATITASPIDYNISGYKLNLKNSTMLQRMTLPEVFITAPGLLITPNSLSAYGKSVSKLYINRREIKLRGDALISYLNSIDVKTITDIEVVSNPDIGDLDGITIRVTTIQEDGGSIMLSNRMNFGFSNQMTAPNFNFSHKHGKFSTYATGFLTHLFTQDSTYTTISEDNNIVKTKTESSQGAVPRTIKTSVGFGYDISPKDYISVDITNINLLRRDKTTYRPENRNLNQQSLTNTLNLSALYNHTFADKGILDLRADYVKSLKDISLEEFFEQRTGTSFDENTKTDSYSIKGRYSTSFLKKDKFSAGAGFSSLSNDFFHKTTNLSFPDYLFSYHEIISNANLSYSYSLEKVSLRAGAKGEYTLVNDFSFVDIIPHVSILFYLNKSRGSTTSLTYSRQKVLPSLSQLTPVQDFSSTIIHVGNTDLQPALEHSYSYNITIRNLFSMEATYTQSNNAITQYTYEKDGLLYQKPINSTLNQSVSIYAEISSINPFKWWNLNCTINYFFTKRSALEMTNKSHAVIFNVVSMMFLPQNINLTTTVYGGSSLRKGINIIESNPLYVDVSASKSFLNRAMRISLNANDILNSDKRRYYEMQMGSSTERVYKHRNSRSFGFSISYNISWGKRMNIKRIDANETRNRITN